MEDTTGLWSHEVTFTYPIEFPTDGIKVKRDLKVMKQRLKRAGIIKNLWVLEFQERGAPHIHMALPESVDKAWLSNLWYEVVGSGDLKHLRAGTRIEPIRDPLKIASYFCGYLRKRKQKTVPEGFTHVGRFWGSTEKIGIISEYNQEFQSEHDMRRALRPVRRYYEAKMRQWAVVSGKRYTWKMRKQGFMVWSGSQVISQLIEKGVFNEKQKEGSEKRVKRCRKVG